MDHLRDSEKLQKTFSHPSDSNPHNQQLIAILHSVFVMTADKPHCKTKTKGGGDNSVCVLAAEVTTGLWSTCV